MSTEKNDYVSYEIIKNKLTPYLLNDFTKKRHNPVVEFYKHDDENRYNIRTFALIPKSVGESFTVIAPEERKEVDTVAGTIVARTITIKWKPCIPPNNLSPTDTWLIDVEYKLLNEKEGEDTAIRVVFEYGDPTLSRGTVTTTGTPPPINPS